MPKNDGTIVMEGVQIVFRNFAGAAGRFNAEGDRNFAVVLPKEIVDDLKADGWNVKQFKDTGYEDEDEGREEKDFWLGVSMGYGRGRDPLVKQITSRGSTVLTEETVSILDGVDVKNVDLIIRPYHWEVNGNQGVKAYLKSMYVTIEEDELALKYAHLDEQE